jgi:hypothetical protein
MTLAAGMSAEFLAVDTVIVPGDAAATAANISAFEQLYRFGFAANLIDYTLYVGVTVILYGLLKPAGAGISLLAAIFSLLGTVAVASASFHYLAPFVFFGDAPYLANLGAGQAQALAFLSHKLRSIGSNIALSFFGLHLLFVGWLIAGSTFLPRPLGVLSAIGGACFLILAFANFLTPPFAAQLLPYILAPGILGQASLALWLLIMGVNAARWREQAGGVA